MTTNTPISDSDDQLTFDAQFHPGSIKAAMKLVGAGSRDLWQVDPHQIKTCDNFNVRVQNEAYDARIRFLADSIKQNGFFQDFPLAGYVAKEDSGEVIYITGGHRRLAAALLAISEGAELTRVPVVVSQSGVSMEDLTVALVIGNEGEPLSLYEVGVVCKRLSSMGLAESEIARRLQRTPQQVKDVLLLIGSSHVIRQMVIDNVVSATFAIEMLNTHGAKALDKLMEAQNRAEAAGKTKVTAKHAAPDAIFKKTVKKAAQPMFEVITEISADPAYQSLSPAVRTKLDELLAKLKAD